MQFVQKIWLALLGFEPLWWPVLPMLQNILCVAFCIPSCILTSWANSASWCHAFVQSCKSYPCHWYRACTCILYQLSTCTCILYQLSTLIQHSLLKNTPNNFFSIKDIKIKTCYKIIFLIKRNLNHAKRKKKVWHPYGGSNPQPSDYGASALSIWPWWLDTKVTWQTSLTHDLTHTWPHSL